MARLLGVRDILISSRNLERATTLADAVGATAVGIEDICARADIIVTVTPATRPLLQAEWIRPGTRIIAVGADSPGKQELDPNILKDALVIADHRGQCLDHGECGWAVREGLLDPASIRTLGCWLAAPEAIDGDRVVVVDLTGVGVQDVQIAKSIWAKLGSSDDT
jgi:ornithine cyclodeaminase